MNLRLDKHIREFAKNLKRKHSRGLLKNPVFYFGFLSLFLFSSIYASSGDLVNVNGLSNSRVVFFNSFFDQHGNINSSNLFSSQASASTLESPDFKIIQGNTLSGVSTPSIITGRVLGNVLGGTTQSKAKKEITEYTVQPGDTIQSIANNYEVSVNTLLLANSLTSSSVIKVGQTLVILPVDGILHVVRSGDTVSGISQTYKAQHDDIIVFNGLANQGDIFIGDILIVPGGVMPKKAAPSVNQVPLADNYFIFPVQGKITQGIHYYNAIDIANKCGTPIYAAAAGVVQRVRYGYNFGGGNNITILHPNGVVTYYGHVQTSLVKPGDKVYVGQNIALVGGQPGTVGAGISTGCHLHFQVVGARNPLSVYAVGANISYK
ncbi:MAG: LysM peptidoglycan-binding domain-containing protein [Candidatus Staskawiczbacteria bacterium]|nr:LysM peptidoglycan-binding domain-containing protein [Candidatus Staskawiczbacteria bacterium]